MNPSSNRQRLTTLIPLGNLERARRFERPTLTLARLCSTPELRPRSKWERYRPAEGQIQGVECEKAEMTPGENAGECGLPTADEREAELYRRLAALSIAWT